MTTVKIKYECKGCGHKGDVEIRERAKDEGIENFMYHAARMAGEDHCRKNTTCMEGKVDLMMPMSSNGIGYVGEPLTEAEMKEVADRVNKKS